MRSIALITIGIIVGMVTGVFTFSRIQQNTHTTSPVTSIAVSSAAQPEPKKPTSPFSPVAVSTATKSKVTTDSPTETTTQTSATKNSVEGISTVVTIEPPDILISEIKHYREAIAYLQHIDTANAFELQTLLMQLGNNRNDTAFSKSLGTAIYQRYGEVDLEAALEHSIAAIENQSEQYTPWSHEGLSILASIDPDYVRNKIEGLQGNKSHSSLKSALYAGIASNDPQQLARDIIENTGHNDGFRFDALSMAMTEWAMQDPESAWHFLQTEADEPTRSMHNDQILYMWFERDPNAAMLEIETLLNNSSTNPEQQYMLTDLYISHLARTDADTAYQWALSQDDPVLKENALMNILHSWDPSDTAGLESFVNQLDSPTRERFMPMAISAMADNMAHTDPQSAMEWADKLPQEQSFDAKINIVSQWSHSDPDAAADWISNLPDTRNNNELMAIAASSFFYSSPETARQLFSKMPPATQADLTQQMMMALDPDSAREWLNEQSNPEVQQIGTVILTVTDPTTDAHTALDMIAGLPQGNNRDGLLFNTIEQRIGTDRAVIQNWVSSTGLLNDDERAMIQQMTSEYSRFNAPFGGHSGMYYLERNSEIEY